MSYDLTARKDPRFSGDHPKDFLVSLISKMEGVEENGTDGFLFQPDAKTWMEIDLENVSEEGDSLEPEDILDASRVNCVSFHIPFSSLNPGFPCFQVAIKIAQALEWELYDPQDDANLDTSVVRKPWWKIW